MITNVASSDTSHYITKSYAINEIPLWYVAGSVIPYVPLRSLASSIGNAAKQYTFLGFKVVPGGTSGSVSVYEDDGATTAYLTDEAFAWTTASYTTSGNTMTVTISTSGTYPELPTSRAYQVRVLNGAPVTAVTVNGQNVGYNRFGKVASVSRPPAANQYYFDFSFLPEGMGTVIDMVNVPVTQTTTVVITFAAGMPDMAGVYGAVTHAIWAKGNLDIERTTPGVRFHDACGSLERALCHHSRLLCLCVVTLVQARMWTTPRTRVCCPASARRWSSWLPTAPPRSRRR